MTVYNVRTDAFEGPLDLLLHLISEAQVDIYDIPVAVITDQYLHYIHTMQELELDLASEYLVMAATLLQIKSQMLLPKLDELMAEEEDWFDEDPREELIEQLIEYKAYKEAASHLKGKEESRHLFHTRQPEDLQRFLTDEEEQKLQIRDVSLIDMLGAFQKLLQRNAWNAPKTKVVQSDEQSVEARMNDLLDELEQRSGRASFQSLMFGKDRSHLVVTFLAILELIKTATIRCVQQTSFDDIEIYLQEVNENGA